MLAGREGVCYIHSLDCPVALMGAFLAAGGVPEAKTFLWVVLAMGGARTCAMGFNRIVDVRFDRKNPRTAERALAAGLVRMWEAWLLVVAAGGLFFFACASLNQLTLLLSPFALARNRAGRRQRRRSSDQRPCPLNQGQFVRLEKQSSFPRQPLHAKSQWVVPTLLD